MAQPNVPDISARSSRGLNASIGTVANYGTSLTGNGGGAVGGANNSIGGTVYNGVASSNSFPVNQSVLDKTNSGGASFVGANESSSNPKYIQDITSNEVDGESVVATSAEFPTPAENVLFPKANVEISAKANGYYEIKTLVAENKFNGIQQTDYLVDDLAKVAEDRQQVLENSNKKIDGAAQGANSEDKFIALGDQVTTLSMNKLPGGVANSNLITGS